MAWQFRMDSEASVWEIASYGSYGVGVARAREQVAKSLEAHALAAALPVQSAPVSALGLIQRVTQRNFGRARPEEHRDSGREPACI